MKHILLLFSSVFLLNTFVAQCNQYIFTTQNDATATTWEYNNCEDEIVTFWLPQGGYTYLRCAELGSVFVVDGTGYAFPLLTEHPNYPSCSVYNQSECPADFDGDGQVSVDDLMFLLQQYGPCEE